jgi:hypothetical protein
MRLNVCLAGVSERASQREGDATDQHPTGRGNPHSKCRLVIDRADVPLPITPMVSSVNDHQMQAATLNAIV